jgi:hypothetical protein
MKFSRTRNLPAILLATVIADGIFSGCEKKEIDPPHAATPAVAIAAPNQPMPAGTANLAFAKLPGKWLRPDGGYILEIRSAAPDGKLEAAYFNPRPIHVAKAEASATGGSVKVFIELRDVNYPGSTYTLVYDPASDQLQGIYYQALQQQSFNVFFTRNQP